MTKGNDPLAAAADRTLTTTRVFDAPREVVFRAWTDPKQFAKWFPPDGFTADCELDVRPGGRLRVDMQGADPALGPDFYEKVFPGSALRAPGPGGRVRALNGLVAALKQGDHGAYVNFLVDEGEGRIRAAYPGKTWDRLRAIKRRYDPTNMFKICQNIPPAA